MCDRMQMYNIVNEEGKLRTQMVKLVSGADENK
jgi:hypothetical protein